VTVPRFNPSRALRIRPRSGADLNLTVTCVPPAKSTPYLKPGATKMRKSAAMLIAVDRMIQKRRYFMNSKLVLCRILNMARSA